ncbi:hypothetical protein Pmani_031749 [Petrolisthes manimaculis]|uniref:Uncharacterized protein n=1 Tax=Petrolisthes manimaculis TaxID=1843537 RepID=A0AAE1NUS3_9EUCA|nr:hypothetical protein Pmani_031749 [Petrolisthes manimaculis]
MADFKEQFEQKLDNLLQSKNDNVVIPRKEKRAQWIAQLLKIEKEGPITSDDYNMKKRFEILRVGDDDRLIGKRKELETEFKFIVCFEEVHQAISLPGTSSSTTSMSLHTTALAISLPFFTTTSGSNMQLIPSNQSK